MPKLTVYSRPGCHLCDEFIDELAVLCRGRARLAAVDVDRDPALAAAFGHRVPVLCLGDREICAVRVDCERVLAAIADTAADPESVGS